MVFVENEEKAKFYCNKYNFEKFTIFRENLVGITLSQKEIRWNKPTYLGAAILDLSKLHLYRFHYEEMGPLFDKKARVMYRDTDSLFYEIETDDIYEDLKQLKHVLDLSDYPKDHHLHSELNKKVPLKLSDELNGDIVMEAVFLKPKAYSVKTLQKVKQSAKGVSKHVKKTLHHDKFKEVLKSKSPLRKLVTSITSDKHTVNITESNKIALSVFDDKRYYLSDGISSYAYGHYKIGQKRKQPSEKPQKSYIEISECETARDLTEQLDTEIEETFSPPDPGFWKTSQIESDEEEIFDFDAAPKEKPFSRCPYIDFEAEEEPPAKKQRMSSKR